MLPLLFLFFLLLIFDFQSVHEFFISCPSVNRTVNLATDSISFACTFNSQWDKSSERFRMQIEWKWREKQMRCRNMARAAVQYGQKRKTTATLRHTHTFAFGLHEFPFPKKWIIELSLFMRIFVVNAMNTKTGPCFICQSDSTKCLHTSEGASIDRQPIWASMHRPWCVRNYLH